MSEPATKTALITGITGQDGAYLARYLLDRNYHVVGLLRRTSADNTARLQYTTLERFRNIELVYGDITDATSVRHALQNAQPDEIYHLASQSDVGLSFTMSEYTHHCIAGGMLALLEAVRSYVDQARTMPKLFNASTSEMFGGGLEPLSENAPFSPKSPYAVAKIAAHQFAVHFREAYDLFIANGIMFNHESPLRGKRFVTRKITSGLAAIKAGRQEHLYLGNLNAQRDWGYAGDFVEAMHAILQDSHPDDYVVATGRAHGIRDVLDIAGEVLELDWKSVVRTDPALLRPTDVDILIGNAGKIEDALGWTPKTSFEAIIRDMATFDLETQQRPLFS